MSEASNRISPLVNTMSSKYAAPRVKRPPWCACWLNQECPWVSRTTSINEQGAPLVLRPSVGSARPLTCGSNRPRRANIYMLVPRVKRPRAG
jgi:hypothetical protein